MTHWHILFFLFFLVQYGWAQQTFFPAAIPLAVRSPYLSCWQFTTKGSTSLNILVLVRVDNITYLFLGYADTVNTTVNLTNTVISPTQTQLIAKAGPMQFNLTFLNPIEPGDWIKQSIPFSYLSLTAMTLDGEAHAVQVHSHLSAEWMSANRSQVIVWNTTTTSEVVYHSVTLQNPAVFNEIATQPEWGTLYYAMKSGGEITHEIAEDSVVLQTFKFEGVLDNQTDTEFRPINDRLPVFGISRDIGTIRMTQDPIVWSVGFITEPAIQYIDETGVPHNRSLFYKTVARYRDDTFLIVEFLDDFANASSRAQHLDLGILQHAGTVSRKLGDLVSLATAQVYGSIQVTVGASGSPIPSFDESDVMAFMKNIGGSKPNRVNAVETLYSAFPALMFIDPKLGGLILESLFLFQPVYEYAHSDLGMNYPNVTGKYGGPVYDQGIEESGNMLIMAFAHARASGDGSLINRYYSVLTSWADYLYSSPLYVPLTQANDQHNLAIKGIIAIKAMYNISRIFNQTSDSDPSSYLGKAETLYARWKDLALAGDQHILAAHEQVDSWVLGYNLFADVWLGTSVVEPSVYQGQSAFIDNLISTSTFSNFGMPVDSLDSDLDVVVSSWNLFVAAMTSNQDLSSNIISRVHDRASYNASAGVFPLSYNSTSGAAILGVAR
ncbi:hypothetical protein EDB84DRAFT_1272333 [Lactarius hengduanensis]|nr:hypothetical protein EDB84DRAFT_1272333 [Lactarius hengduanensis]